MLLREGIVGKESPNAAEIYCCIFFPRLGCALISLISVRTITIHDTNTGSKKDPTVPLQDGWQCLSNATVSMRWRLWKHQWGIKNWFCCQSSLSGSGAKSLQTSPCTPEKCFTKGPAVHHHLFWWVWWKQMTSVKHVFPIAFLRFSRLLFLFGTHHKYIVIRFKI